MGRKLARSSTPADCFVHLSLLRVMIGFTVVVTVDTLLLLASTFQVSFLSYGAQRIQPLAFRKPHDTATEETRAETTAQRLRSDAAARATAAATAPASNVDPEALLGEQLLASPHDKGLLRRAFAPVVTPDEKKAMLKLLSAVAEAFRVAGVSYFLYGGTMLGSYRHHGMIPWDDDLDIIANVSQTHVIKRALRAVPDHVLYTKNPPRFKFYSRYSKLIHGRKWKWPYVDISFFAESPTEVYDIDPRLTSFFTYPKADVFPTILGVFEDMELPVPCNLTGCVWSGYNASVCQTLVYSHKNEENIDKSLVHGVPCSLLYELYPFAFRDDASIKSRSVLKIADRVLSAYVPRAP